MKKGTITLIIIFCMFSVSSFAQLNMTLLGHLTYSSSLASLWGYAANGKEYALVGAYGGLSIVDITVPTSPTEVQFVPTNNSSWHEIKTWSHYAYVVNESGGGMLIVDLSNLPNAVTYVYFTGGGLNLHTGHTVWIDEHGICYVNGSNVTGGVVFLDLNTDPMNPAYLGQYSSYYVHDCYVRGDTMWTSEIYQGWFRAIDVSNKSSPVLLGQQSTPGNFNHNTSLSNNGDYLFTTDEVSNSYVTSYNVSDLSNITELDRFQANPGTNSIGHNVHVKGNFIVIAYYRDGVIIADATHPDNLIKVGYYDTSPTLSGSGYNGCWGVYPYLPSGNIIAADIEQGLYVLGVTYKQACYLTGTVTDYSTGAALNGVTVTIVNATNATGTTNLSGQYATGYNMPAKYSVTFSKAGYWTKTFMKVSLSSGVNTLLNTSLKSTSLPDCAAPTNLSADNITYTSATMHWSDEYANSYAVKLKNLSNGQLQSFSSKTNSYNATGLASCTSYQFRVKPKCSSGAIVAFSSWYTFSTNGPTCKGMVETASTEEDAVKIYPNPFSDELNISLTLQEDEAIAINLYDAWGRKVFSKNYDHASSGVNYFSLDESSLAEGVYVCLIQMDEGIVTRKIVKAGR